MIQKTLKELAALIQATVHGDSDHLISGVNTLENAHVEDLSFFTNIKYKNQLLTTQAGVVILNREAVDFCPTNALIVDNPHFAYAKIVELFSRVSKPESCVHPTAVIGKNCQLDPSVYIGPYVVINDDVIIGANSQIDAHCIIGKGTKIGSNCHLWPHVSVYYDVTIHDRVIIHSGTVVGEEGLGFARTQQGWYKVPQIGSVIIESDVEIGANNCIDRGALKDTIIEQGVKIGNSNVIAHNCHIGTHTLIVGQVGFAGTTTVGKNCVIGGGAGFAGHLEIADGCMFTARANIANSVKKSGVYSSGTGTVMSNQVWRKNAARFRHLDELAKRIKELEKKSL